MATVLALVLLAPTPRASDTLVLKASGSTFVYPIMSRWIAAFARRNPSVEVIYQPLGSGRGVQDALSRAVDFGATDDPMSDQELASLPGMLHVPIALGAVVPVYNVAGVTGLRLSPEVLARIFLGRVARWDDPQIARDNPELRLPPLPICVAHRADSSGTTAIFTKYLSKASAEWRSGPGAGRAVRWPGGTGLRGNEGVAGVVSRGDGWIGYVELGYAIQARLSIAQLRSSDGTYVSPSIATISAAAARAQVPDDFRISLVDVGGATWPMSGFTWALITREQRDPARAKALIDFLWWCTHEGQAMASDLGFAPLPTGLVGRIEGALKTVRAGDNLVQGVR
jgi:phosphate transport system substrate-binding protein